MSNSPARRKSKPPAGAAADFPSFNDDPKARVKGALQSLIFLSESYPELLAHFQPSIELLTAEAKRTTRSTRDRVLLLLERAISMTFEELQGDLVIPEDELRRFLGELVAADLVDESETGRRIDPNKGRREKLYKIKHSSPTGCSYAAPSRGGSATRATMDALSD